jgi:hypothetical protein
MSIRLQTGITGFLEDPRQSPPMSDFRAFRSVCYAAARALGGSIVACEEPYGRGANNFAIVTVKLQTQTVAVMLNAHFHLVGFAEPSSIDQQEIRFLGSPELAQAIASSDKFKVLDAEALQANVTAEAEGALSPGEISQVRYWKPRRIGDIIFNFWD